MARGNTALKLLTWLTGIVALLGFAATVLAVVTLYALGAGTLDVPVIGGAVVFVPPAVTVLATLVWAVLLGIRRYLITDDRRTGAPMSTESTAAHGARAGSTPEAESRTHLREFNRANAYLAAILGVLLLVSVIADPLTAAVSGTPLGIVVGFLVFATTTLGGTTTLLVAAAWFGLTWYGVRTYAATEAWLAGLAGWTLLTLSGLSLLTTSLGAIAIVVGGVQVLRYGLGARGETEVAFLKDFLERIETADARTPDARTPDAHAAGTHATDDARPSAEPHTTADADTDDGATAPDQGASNRVATASGTATTVDDAADHPDTAGQPADGRFPITAIRSRFRNPDIDSLADLRAFLDVEPVFVHPREAGHDRLTYLSYLSYAIGGLLLLSSLLVGVQLWGFPALGVWGIPAGAVFLGHAFGLPQRSPVVHALGLGWYVLGLLVALFTVSPIAILATAAGVYFGWTATAGVPQPEAVIAAAQGTTADADRSDAGAVDTRAAETSIEGIVGGGLLAGIGLGAVLGVLGAAVFAWVSVRTQAVYGLLVVLPALAAGAGVAVGVGDRAGRPSGLAAAALAVVSIVVGFRLLNRWMPPFYELQPSPLLAIVPLVGIYLAYRLGSTAAVDADAGAGTSATDDADRDRPADRSATDRDRDVQ